VSTEQALLDFDVANARVIDLSQRLIEAAAQSQKDRDELAALREQYEQTSAHYEELKATKAYRLIQVIWSVRKRLHV